MMKIGVYFVIMLLLMLILTGQAKSRGSHTCLSGKWKYNPAYSKNLNAMMTALGRSWIEKNVLKTMPMTQLITVFENKLTIAATTPVLSRTQVFFLDGKPRVLKNLKGRQESYWCKIIPNGVLFFQKNAKGIITYTRRTCSGRKMINTFKVILPSGKIIRAQRGFDRVR